MQCKMRQALLGDSLSQPVTACHSKGDMGLSSRTEPTSCSSALPRLEASAYQAAPPAQRRSCRRRVWQQATASGLAGGGAGEATRRAGGVSIEQACTASSKASRVRTLLIPADPALTKPPSSRQGMAGPGSASMLQASHPQHPKALSTQPTRPGLTGS